VNQEPLIVPDARGVVDYLPAGERGVLAAQNVRACLPVIVADRLRAIVLLTSDDGPPLPDTSIEAIGLCARHLSLACDRVSRIEEDRERLQAIARAQQLAVAGQLAASVAHEIRNPLTAIRSSVQFVAEGVGDPAGAELLRQVIAEVDRINRRLSGVLGLSRPHALDLQPHDLDALVNEALDLMAPHFTHQQLRIERDLAPGLHASVDAGEIRQVLLNVLLNASQATVQSGRIQVRLRRDDAAPAIGGGDSPDGRAIITIADAGAGMSADQVARAFDPFFTTKRSGSGLGLPICRDIMNRHRGTIALESRLGSGTTVVLALPLLPRA
jgi:signal transduction histidine kinase